MLNTRQNFHHSKLPALGEIVTAWGLGVRVNLRSLRPTLRRFIVEAFPLCDNVRPWSLGIHTVHLSALDNGERVRVAGHWLETEEGRP